MKKIDDEKCDMCGKKLDKEACCVRMKRIMSSSTIIYFLCPKCYDCVDEYIQECRNLGYENE